jgi:hypothetical protein
MFLFHQIQIFRVYFSIGYTHKIMQQIANQMVNLKIVFLSHIFLYFTSLASYPFGIVATTSRPFLKGFLLCVVCFAGKIK